MFHFKLSHGAYIYHFEEWQKYWFYSTVRASIFRMRLRLIRFLIYCPDVLAITISMRIHAHSCTMIPKISDTLPRPGNNKSWHYAGTRSNLQLVRTRREQSVNSRFLCLALLSAPRYFSTLPPLLRLFSIFTVNGDRVSLSSVCPRYTLSSPISLFLS